MVTRQQLEGKWNEVSGRIKEKWGVMTDDDLSRPKERRTPRRGDPAEDGQAREEVERFLDSIVAGSRPAMERIASTAEDYAASARDYAAERAGHDARRQYENVEQSISAGYQEAEECVRRRPVESVAIAFGRRPPVGRASGRACSAIAAEPVRSPQVATRSRESPVATVGEFPFAVCPRMRRRRTHLL